MGSKEPKGDRGVDLWEAYLVFFLARPVFEQVVPVENWGLGYCNKCVGVGKVRSGWSVGSTGVVGKGEVRLQLVICCSARDKD